MSSELAVLPLFWTEQKNIPTSPKQFAIREIAVVDAIRVNRAVHSRLPWIAQGNVVRNRRYICYGAVYEGRYYASAIWSSPVAANRLKDGDKLLELRRMAICGDAPRNTATFMIAKMVKDIAERFPEIIRCISYQDTEVHSGTIYKAANWQAVTANNGEGWSTGKRVRNKEQTTAPKVRWEYEIRRG